MLPIEILVDLFHITTGFPEFFLVNFNFVDNRQQAVFRRGNLVHFEIDPGQFGQFLFAGGQRTDDIIPFQVDLLPYFLRGAGLVNIDGTEAEITGAVNRYPFGNSRSRRRGHIDSGNTQFFQGNGDNRCCRGSTHIAKSDNSRGGFFLGQHRRVFFQLIGVFATNRLHIVNEIGDPQFPEALFDPDKDLVVIDEGELCVVVKQDLPFPQIVQGHAGGQFDYGPFLIPAGVKNWVELSCHSLSSLLCYNVLLSWFVL